MVSSIIHPRRLFAVRPSSDPAARKKKKRKKASDVEKIKCLLSFPIADGENEPLVLSRQALLAVGAAERLSLNAAGGGSRGSGDMPRCAAPLVVCFQRAHCAAESLEKGGTTVCTLHTHGFSASSCLNTDV